MKPSLPGSITSRTTTSKTRRSFSSRIERLLAVARDDRLVALGLEVEAQAVGDVLLVFDDQDAAHDCVVSRGSSERERGAASFALALREDAAAVRARDRPDDVEAEAGALDLPEAARLHAVEAVEDPLELLAAGCRRRDPARAPTRCPAPARPPRR